MVKIRLLKRSERIDDLFQESTMSDKDDNNQNNDTSQSVDVIEKGQSSPTDSSPIDSSPTDSSPTDSSPTDSQKNDIVSDQCVPGSPTGSESVLYISQHPLGDGNQSPPAHCMVDSPTANIDVAETTATTTSSDSADHLHQNQGENSPQCFTNSPNDHHSPVRGSSGGATSPGHSSPASSSSSMGHGQQHVVHVHINPGETFSVRVGDQLQHIQGPATVRMVSNNGPPLPMPMQVPPGHMVQQIVDENGILTHVILSPQPPGMMSNPMTVGFYGGPNNTAQYYPPYGGPYASHPQYPSAHHHSHPPPPHVHGVPHTHPHGTPPPPNCNSHNHGPIHHPSGPSPPLNSMEDRNIRQRIRVRKKYQARVEDGVYSYRDRIPPRRAKQTTAAKGINGEVSNPNLIAQSSTPLSSEPETEIEEERRVLQQQLSSMPEPQTTDIEARSALIHLSPPEFDQNEFDINPADFGYELSLSDKGRDGKYKIVYNGDATEITLKDLKPATEFHLRVCALLDDLRGNPTEPISFKTLPCEPDQPQPPKLMQKTKTTLMLKWGLPCENGAKISTYTLEYDEGLGTGNFIEIYNGLQRQHKVSKLQTSTRYTFRLAAINSVGKSGFSEPVTFYTSGSVPVQPDPPMLSECSVHALTVSWIRRPNDDEFVLQFEDESTGHGFIPIYNGQNLSYIKDGLRRNTAYRFRLAAKNEEGQSKWSDIVVYHTSPDRPSPPGKPQIKGKIYANSFRVTWDPPKDSGGSEITKYIVELDDGNGSGYEMLYEGSEREHACDHLIPGQMYRVRVACSSKGGRSEFSECCVATTQCVPPGQCHAPKLQGKPKATSLHLRWAYPDYNGGVPVTDFSVQMILPDNTSREVYKGRDLDCIVAGLSPGRPFLFQVRAFNRAGGGPWSELLEVISGAGIPDPPKIPLINCKSPHSAIVIWEEPVNNGATITDYRLEWQLKTESDFTQLYFGPNLSFEVKGLSPAMLYSFRVQALNSAGPGLYSPVATCVTPPSRPSAVLSIKAQASATSIHLQWHEPNNNGSEIISYNIDIGEKQLISINAVTEYVIEDLLPETGYKIRIQAVNAIGVGAFSSAIKVTTRTLPPSPPKMECVAAGPNNLRLKWGEGRNLDLITYRLEMEREDGNYQEIYRGQAYSFKVGRLAELTCYDFRILASNDAGDGPYSDTYTFITTKAPPPALRAPRVTDVDLTTAQVLWQGCRSIGSDAMVYVLQLQDKDQEYHEVYKGADTCFVLQNLQPKTDYQVRVCAIRESNDDIGDIMGAFSPGTGFVTRNPEPVEKAKPVVQDDSVTEPKQMSIQQMTAIAVGVFFLVSVLIAFIIQQFIAYMTPSSRS